jgi:hypothetical protein
MSTSSRRIRIPHPNLNLSQRTYLSADYSSGTTLSVKNNEGFGAQQIAIIGEPGHEKCEGKAISSLVAKTSLILAAPGYNLTHNSGDVLYRSEYDAVEISANSGSGWTVLQSSLNIQWDQLDTIYVHDGGTNSYSYRFRFYNTVSGNYSEYSGTIAGTGYTSNMIGYHLREVRKMIQDPEKKIISDQEILRFFSEAKNIIRAMRNDWWFWKRESLGDITTTADINKYNLDTISAYLDYIADIRYRYVSGSTIDEIYPLDNKPDIIFDDFVRDNLRQSDDQVRFYNIMPGDVSSTSGYIRVSPTPKTTAAGSFYVRWYINEADYTSGSDTTSIPVPQLLQNFAISQCEKIKGNEAKAKVYENLFYGPPQKARDRANLMGIAILEQMQNGKGRATHQPRSIKKFYGRRAEQRLYSEGSTLNNDDYRERYF